MFKVDLKGRVFEQKPHGFVALMTNGKNGHIIALPSGETHEQRTGPDLAPTTVEELRRTWVQGKLVAEAFVGDDAEQKAKDAFEELLTIEKPEKAPKAKKVKAEGDDAGEKAEG